MDLFDGLRDPQVIARYRDRPQAFTRERKLPFRVLVGLLLNQVKGAWQREVGDFFERCLQGAQSVSAAAVCLARKALDPGVFVDLNQRLVALVAAALRARVVPGKFGRRQSADVTCSAGAAEHRRSRGASDGSA